MVLDLLDRQYLAKKLGKRTAEIGVLLRAKSGVVIQINNNHCEKKQFMVVYEELRSLFFHWTGKMYNDRLKQAFGRNDGLDLVDAQKYEKFMNKDRVCALSNTRFRYRECINKYPIALKDGTVSTYRTYIKDGEKQCLSEYIVLPLKLFMLRICQFPEPQYVESIELKFVITKDGEEVIDSKASKINIMCVVEPETTKCE